MAASLQPVRAPARRSARTITKSGVMRKLKASSLKVLKFIVPVAIPFTGNASKHPTNPPIKASIIDSITKLVNMLRLRETRALAACRSHACGERPTAYIVFIPPKHAPMPMMIATKMPSSRIGPDALVCSS